MLTSVRITINISIRQRSISVYSITRTLIYSRVSKSTSVLSRVVISWTCFSSESTHQDTNDNMINKNHSQDSPVIYSQMLIRISAITKIILILNMKKVSCSKVTYSPASIYSPMYSGHLRQISRRYVFDIMSKVCSFSSVPRPSMSRWSTVTSWPLDRRHNWTEN